MATKFAIAGTEVEVRRFRPSSGNCLTAYAVYVGGAILGYVYSREGFSYRGTQGWNRGVRLRDYHPKEWRYSDDTDFYHRRDGIACGLRDGVEKLVRERGKVPHA